MIVKSLRAILRGIPFVRRLLQWRAEINSERFVRLEDPCSRNHFWMYLRKDSYMEREFMRNGLYGGWEKESLKIWAVLSERSNYIIDIGANTGVYSLIAKSQNPRSHVFAVEPVDLNFEVLSKNIKKNRLDIIAEKVALSSKDGFAKMYMLSDQLNYMTSVNDNRYDKHPEIVGDSQVVEIEVAIKTYQYLEEKYKIPKVDLVKIDTEGHEVEILESMKPFLRRDKPAILLEVIGAQNAQSLNELFLTLGYSFISIDEVSISRVVRKLWDNDHHNFLICDIEVVKYLRSKGLVQ